jgi:hypothetical protein
MGRVRAVGIVVVAVAGFAGPALPSEASEPTPDLRGAWAPESYLLADGGVLPVEGRIFFTDSEWTVLFFVTVDGAPRRGSGEGGTYTLAGRDLVFTHRYHLSEGAAVGSLAESPLRMELHGAGEAPTEPARVELDGDRLTIRFGPSGNRMTFRRSSGF